MSHLWIHLVLSKCHSYGYIRLKDCTMAKEFLSNMAESQVPATPPVNPEREPVKIMAVGSRWAVLLIIHTLHRLGFAQAGE
jgi:hypothetical protein